MTGGNLDFSGIVNKEYFNAIFVFIVFKECFQIIGMDSDSHHADGISLAVGNSAIDEDGDFISGAGNFVIVDIQGIFSFGIQKGIIPGIFGIISGQRAVNAVKVIIPPCGCGNQKYGVEMVFFMNLP